MTDSVASTSKPPHAPEVGLLGRVLGAFGVTGVFWYRLHRFGVRIVPDRAKSIIMGLFTLLFFCTLWRIRKAIAANLVAVLGPCGWFGRQARIFRTMHQFAWCLTERYERLVTELPFEFETENREAWDSAVAAGRGVVLVTGHVGNWEVGSVLPASAEQQRVHLVREEELDPRAQHMIETMLRERLDPGYTTHFASDDPRLGLRLLEALQRGEVVALQADRPRRTGKSLRTELFGRPFDLPRGPLALARTAGVPLLPTFVLREGRRRYRIVFREPVPVPRQGNGQCDLAAPAAALMREIEVAIRRRPHQWFCWRDLWGGAAPAEDPGRS